MQEIKGIVIESDTALSFEELLNALQVEPTFIVELVEYQLIIPQGKTQDEWHFDAESLRKARLARNFYHDLEINMPGISLALELLDRIEKLENELNKHK